MSSKFQQNPQSTVSLDDINFLLTQAAKADLRSANSRIASFSDSTSTRLTNLPTNGNRPALQKTEHPVLTVVRCLDAVSHGPDANRINTI